MRPKPPTRRRIRPGLLLRRQPRLRIAVVATAVVIAGTSVASAIERAERAEAAWGAGHTVVVVTRDLEPGDLIDGSNTDVVDRPSAVIPDGAPSSVPEGARAGAAVMAGEVLLGGHLAPHGLTELTARLPPHTRAVAIPSEPGTTPALSIGDTVDVLVALAPEAASAGPPGFTIAAGALVVDVSDAAITVAVSTGAAPRIAVALGQGAVTLALVGLDGRA